MPIADAPAFTAIALSRGRSATHISSPSIALVAQAESSLGAGNTTGLSSSYAPTREACFQLRVQRGTKTRGTLKRRVHALQGLEWCSNTFLVSLFRGEGIRTSFNYLRGPRREVLRPPPSVGLRSLGRASRGSEGEALAARPGPSSWWPLVVLWHAVSLVRGQWQCSAEQKRLHVRQVALRLVLVGVVPGAVQVEEPGI